MSSIFLYNHGGSENHGCEALVRTASALIKNKAKLLLFSDEPQQDFWYELQKQVQIIPAKLAYSKLSFGFLKAYYCLKKGDYFPLDVLPYRKSLKSINEDDIEISVGGDIYCYDDYMKYILLHDLICKRGCKTVLLGCSLGKELFSNPDFIVDIKKYDYISARESLTFQLLKEAGLTNIGCCPDSAFTLPAEFLMLPKEFQENNTIGVNVSPLVIGKEKKPGIVYENFANMIYWILEHTDCSVALIPHVVWEDNDDRTALKQIHEKFKDTNRVLMIDDCNCMQLKGHISRCRFFIGARTHATIAAYSTCVPTLALGYSIKARGIATDIFGTEENYVISVQNMLKEDILTNAFIWLWEHEQEIRSKLKHVMPKYIESAKKIRCDVMEHLGENIWI